MQGSIIIVDDNADDAALIKRAVVSLRSKCPVRAITGSRELQNWLEGRGRYADQEAFPYPSLILLDLRMPEMDGFELLAWLRQEPRHAAIPVIAISSFDRQPEIRRSYQLGARTFLSKPVDPKSIRSAIRALRLPIEFFD